MLGNSRPLSAALALALAVGALGACRPAAEPAPEPEAPVADLAALAPGWNTIEPGGDTTCSDGTPYRFFARAGDPEKLMVYFQGGGGCWTGATCDPDLEPSYTVNLAKLETVRASGIFDFENTENPFASWSAVFVPYCSGDVHLGDRDASYEAPAKGDHQAHEVMVHHRGVTNARAALDWTYGHFFRPATVFVAGSSAGSIPSPWYAAVLADRYPEARVAQLGDGSGGYRRSDQTTSPATPWGTLEVLSANPYFDGMAETDFNYERLYVATGQSHPEVALAAYDTAEDSVQKRFLALSGNDTESLQTLIDANQADIRAKISTYRSFVAGGDVHTVLMRPEFYTYRVGDVRVRDWVAKLAAGEPVEDVHCGDCSVAEVTEDAGGERTMPSGG